MRWLHSQRVLRFHNWRPDLKHQWPTIPISIASAILTIFSVILLLELKIEADVYGLLGQDDEAVQMFAQLSKRTPGLEELLVICERGSVLKRSTIERITDAVGVKEHTRSYLQAGKSAVYGFSLTVDPADWHETRPIIGATTDILRETSSPCGMTGTPAIVFEMQNRVDKDLRFAIALAVVLVSLLFAFVYRIGLLALFMMMPVGLGIAWGLAAYSLMRTELTLLAATVPTLLIGIGIDHCIHMIQSCRYAMTHDRMPRHQAVIVAWRRMLQPITLASLTTAITFWRRHGGRLEEVFAETGLAIIVTVTTSVAAFGTFIVSDSPSLIRFGSQASLALIACLILTLTVLPTIARRLLPSDEKSPSELSN